MLIDSGELQSGDQLPPERELARRLKVSRPSLRTGIAFLGMIGVVKIRHGSGTYVSPESCGPNSSSAVIFGLDGTVSSQLFEAQRAIRGTIAGLAAQRRTSRCVAELAEEITEMYASLDDPYRYSIHDDRFYRKSSQAAGNAVLDAVLEALSVSVPGTRTRTGLSPGVLRQTVGMHHEIYRAIRSRNSLQAKLLMEQYLGEVLPIVPYT